MKPAILYITYDGILEPLGQSQVLAYQELLAKDYDIHLLSYEKPSDWADVEARKSIAARMENAGIHWHPRKYHKKPSAIATAYDIAMGIAVGLRLIRSNRIRIVHARSYVPSVMALVLKIMTGVKYIFDMRGFWADERVDGGLWPRAGRMYRVAKWFERKFFLSTDHIVSLTHAAVNEFTSFQYLKNRLPPITIIPTCADLDQFIPLPAEHTDKFILGYVGSAGTWHLFDVVLNIFNELLKVKPNSKLIIINRDEHEFILGRLKSANIQEQFYELKSAKHNEIPQIISTMDAGVFIYKPSYSRSACSPTKLGEFLGCGKPCISNSGVGDLGAILENENVGVALDSFDVESLNVGINGLLSLIAEDDISVRCRRVAEKYFSLEEGVKKYASIYEELSAK